MPNVITRPQVKVNKMRKEQYDAIVPASDEFYIITDSPDSVDQVNTPSIVYGTDENGDQTTYGVDSFGNVDDVKVDGVSVVDENKVANIDLTGKQNKLTAGTNITISGNTISATDTKYTAGTNISISSDNVISAIDTTYSAGTGIEITGTTISTNNITWRNW